jgi:proteasome lid subunit RPN8/RPN11
MRADPDACDAEILIPRVIADAMIEHAFEEAPAEACGLLAGAQDQAVHIYRIPNSDPSIYRYCMEPRAQVAAIRDMDAHGWDMLAIYHSHTHTPAYPSPTDIGLAFYADAHYVIVGLREAGHPELRAYRIVDGRVSEVGVHIES